MKRLLLSAAAVLAVLSACSREPMDKLTARVFATAATQYQAMDATLDEGMLPRTIRNGALRQSDPTWWCAGFFPGSLWYIYLYSGDEAFRALADKNTAKVWPETQKARSHDIGFVTNCSYGNAFRITGDTLYRQPVIDAAHALCKRYNPVIGCTRSWNFSSEHAQWEFPVIIDNMMNLELLMEGYRLCGVDSLKAIALSHANTTLKNHFRPDYTSWHVVDYCPEDGHVNMKCTHQGYSDDSAWARGQAWGLYGYTMMARKSGEPAYLSQAENIAKMLLKRLPKDGIPYWDFDAPDIPDALRDASAGAIMASAFIDLARQTADSRLAKQCRKMAEEQLRTLASPEYLAPVGENCHFLLRHSVGFLPGNSEVDVPLTYADYYFLEALLKWQEVL
jgi:hypothetical protein